MFRYRRDGDRGGLSWGKGAFAGQQLDVAWKGTPVSRLCCSWRSISRCFRLQACLTLRLCTLCGKCLPAAPGPAQETGSPRKTSGFSQSCQFLGLLKSPRKEGLGDVPLLGVSLRLPLPHPAQSVSLPQVMLL